MRTAFFVPFSINLKNWSVSNEYAKRKAGKNIAGNDSAKPLSGAHQGRCNQIVTEKKQRKARKPWPRRLSRKYAAKMIAKNCKRKKKKENKQVDHAESTGSKK